MLKERKKCCKEREKTKKKVRRCVERERKRQIDKKEKKEICGKRDGSVVKREKKQKRK